MKIHWNVGEDEREVILEVDYTPERPAPPASDPDSNAFSDPGNGESIEITSAIYADTLEEVPDDIVEILGADKELEDEVADKYRESQEPDWPDSVD